MKNNQNAIVSLVAKIESMTVIRFSKRDVRSRSRNRLGKSAYPYIIETQAGNCGKNRTLFEKEIDGLNLLFTISKKPRKPLAAKIIISGTYADCLPVLQKQDVWRYFKNLRETTLSNKNNRV